MSAPTEVADALGYLAGDGYVSDGAATATSARQYVWGELQRKTGVEAAYFRGAAPLVAFATTGDEVEVAACHRRLWNHGRVPLLITTGDEIAVYSCYAKPTSPDRAQAARLAVARSADRIADDLAAFARSEIDAGRGMTQQPEKMRRSHRVDRQLLLNLSRLRASLVASGTSSQVLDGLLGRVIFIRYLEDRGIVSGSNVRDMCGHDSLTDALAGGVDSTYALFDGLKSHFNGDVFAWDAGEHASVKNSALHRVEAFLSGVDLDSGQQRFWPYDFAVIPPELISSIYEELLAETQRRDAAYYTPRHVVDLILDQVLPLDEAGTPTVLDPACGSGIFLAEAYRRLLFRQTIGTSLGKGEEPSHVLTRCIFGVDSSAAAVTVTAFSLYLALLEQYGRTEAWESVKLPKLVGSNLVVGDYFSDHPLRTRRFDLIVGNPPWQSNLSDPAQKFLAASKLPVADQQMATAFVWAAGDQLGPGGQVGMLVPAKPFLHNRHPRALAVRRHLFAHLEVDTVVDLSPTRRDLFQAAVGPAAVLIARRQGKDGRTQPDDVVHAVARPNPLGRGIDAVVVDAEDIHRIPRGVAEAYPDCWKIYLWGSKRDLALITRLRELFPTVGDLARDRGWRHGQGFQIAGGDRKPASEVTALPLVSTDSIGPLSYRTESWADPPRFMHRPRDPELYRAPHVLLRRTVTVDGTIGVAFVPRDAAHSNGVVGISGGRRDRDELLLLAGFFSSSLFRYLQFLTNSTWGVERPAIEANEVLSTPLAEPSGRATRAILDATTVARRARRGDRSWQQRLDKAVFDLFGLDSRERQLVTDVVRAQLGMHLARWTSDAFRPPTRADISRYCRSLQEQVRELLPELEWGTCDSRRVGSFLAVTVPIGATSPTDVSDAAVLDALAEGAESGAEALVVRPSSIRVAGNKVHVVKPAESHLWTESRGVDDALNLAGYLLSIRSASNARSR